MWKVAQGSSIVWLVARVRLLLVAAGLVATPLRVAEAVAVAVTGQAEVRQLA